jgi:outer membrane protein TolC
MRTDTHTFWRRVPTLFAILGVTLLTCAQSPNAGMLTLAQAERIALLNHPRIASEDLRAQASTKRVSAQKAAYYPTVAGNLTGTLVADPGTATAAGNLTNGD